MFLYSIHKTNFVSYWIVIFAETVRFIFYISRWQFILVSFSSAFRILNLPFVTWLCFLSFWIITHALRRQTIQIYHELNYTIDNLLISTYNWFISCLVAVRHAISLVLNGFKIINVAQDWSIGYACIIILTQLDNTLCLLNEVLLANLLPICKWYQHMYPIHQSQYVYRFPG